MTTACLTFTARMETVQWWCTKAPSYKAYQLHGTISVADKLRKVQGTQHLNAQFFSSPWFFSELLLRLSDDAIFAYDGGTIGHFLFVLFLPHLDQLLAVGQLATFFQPQEANFKLQTGARQRYVVDCPTFKSAKTDSYFHILVFVFVSCLLCFMTNIKVTNMKNTSGKSARTKGASQQVGDVDDKQQIHTLRLRQKLKFFLVWVFCTSPNNQTNK